MSSRENHAPRVRRAPAMRLVAVFTAVLALSACGKKGPLYLPDQAAATGASQTAAPPAKK